MHSGTIMDYTNLFLGLSFEFFVVNMYITLSRLTFKSVLRSFSPFLSLSYSLIHSSKHRDKTLYNNNNDPIILAKLTISIKVQMAIDAVAGDL